MPSYSTCYTNPGTFFDREVEYTQGVDVHETMWHSEEFSSYLQKNERFDFEHVQQQMKNIAKHALLSVQGKVAKSRPIEVR